MTKGYILRLLGVVALFGVVSSKADPMFQLSSGIVQANEHQVMTISYDPSGYVVGDNAYLNITMDGSHTICLYPTYDGGSCSGTPVCTSATNTWETPKQLIGGGANDFTLGLTVTGLDALAAKDGGSPSGFNCLDVTLGYAKRGGGNAIIPGDQSGNYVCEVASSGGSFVGGTSGNPCTSNPSQAIVES